MLFNTTFNNISVISWRSILLVEETRVPGENHWPSISYWQLYPIMYRVHLAWTGFELAMLVMIGADCIGSCKSNYDTIRSWPRKVSVYYKRGLLYNKPSTLLHLVNLKLFNKPRTLLYLANLKLFNKPRTLLYLANLKLFNTKNDHQKCSRVHLVIAAFQLNSLDCLFMWLDNHSKQFSNCIMTTKFYYHWWRKVSYYKLVSVNTAVLGRCLNTLTHEVGVRTQIDVGGVRLLVRG